MWPAAWAMRGDLQSGEMGSGPDPGSTGVILEAGPMRVGLNLGALRNCLEAECIWGGVSRSLDAAGCRKGSTRRSSI